MKDHLRLLFLHAALFACSIHAQSTATVTDSDASFSKPHLHSMNNKAPPAWGKDQFPNPQVAPSKCRTTSNRLCDPDGIMIDMERQRLVHRIEQLESKHSVACSTNGSTENKHELQMAVALANRMDLIPYGRKDGSEEAAQDFAVHLHNKWGVGVDTNSCGGTGMLLFFSIRDRAFFLSRGKALDAILTDSRVDRIMENQVKPLLRQERYVDAFLALIDGLDQYLARGPPTKSELRQEWLEQLLPLSIFALMFGMMGWKMRNERRESRAYAQVSSQLSQLDRDRAEALQGRYECKSCPICLEKFQIEDEAADEQNPPTKGSDGLPLKLLRCGHVFDETCWSEWVSSGTGNVRRCPICQQDVASTNERNAATAVTPQQPQQQQRQQANDDNNNNGNFADNRVFRQFHRERNFRLARLGMRFPHFVGQQQLHAWTQTNYDGTLARDPSFLRNNPRVVQQQRQNSSMGRRSGGSSFGGGSSGGGRGGSW